MALGFDPGSQAAAARAPEQFFHVGGTLKPSTPSYVPRQADSELLQALRNGELCYVLDTRQMGKSSLINRVGRKLKSEGAAVAFIDLTSLGSSVTIDQWYGAHLGRLGKEFRLEDEIDSFIDRNEHLGPVDLWSRAIRDVILPSLPNSLVVIVFDEIDYVRALPFPTDEYFAAIRHFVNGRPNDPDLERLTFCLLGVATPTDLIRAQDITPFNLGRRIVLTDFSDDEASILKDGLHSNPLEAEKLLHRVLYWTDGHPYLTQSLCDVVARDRNPENIARVDELCWDLFLAPGAREQNENLRMVTKRLLGAAVDPDEILGRYQAIRSGVRPPFDTADPLTPLLHLSGIAKVENGTWRVRNRIYERVFDDEWIREQLTPDEIRRQEQAARKARRRAATIFGAILLAVLSTAVAVFAIVGQRNAQRLQRLEQANSDGLKKALDDKETAREAAEKAQGEFAKQALEAEKNRLAAEIAQKAAVAQARLAEEKTIEATKLRDAALVDQKNLRAAAEKLRVQSEALQQETNRANAATAEVKTLFDEAQKKSLVLQRTSSQLQRKTEVLIPLQFSTQSNIARTQQANLIDRAALLAIEALGRAPSLDGYVALRGSLGMMPAFETVNLLGNRRIANLNHLRGLIIVETLSGTVPNVKSQTCVLDPAPKLLGCVDAAYGSIASVWPDRLITHDGGDLNSWDLKTQRASAIATIGSVLAPPLISSDGSWWANTNDKGRFVFHHLFQTGRKSVQQIRDPKTPNDQSIPLSDSDRWYGLVSSGDGDIAVLAGPRGYAICNPHDGKIQLRIPEGLPASELPLVSPNKRYVFFHGRRSLYRLPSGPRSPAPQHLELPDPQIATLAAFSNDDRILAKASPASVTLWDLSTARPLATLPQSDRVNFISFDTDSQFVAISQRDLDTVRVFTNTGQELARVKAPGLLAGVFSGRREDLRLTTFSKDGIVRKWHTSGWTAPVAKGSGDRIVLPVGPDLPFLTVPRAFVANQTIRVRDAKTGVIRSVLYHPDAIQDLHVSADARFLVTTSRQTLNVLDLRNPGTPYRITFTGTGAMFGSGFQGQRFAVSDSFCRVGLRCVLVYDAADRKVVFERPFGEPVYASLTQDGQQLNIVSSSGMLQAWDLNNGRITFSRKLQAVGFMIPRFTSDGSVALIAQRDNSVLVWNTRANDIVELKISAQRAIYGSQIAGTHLTLATGSKLDFYSLLTGNMVGQIDGAPASAILSPKGRYLAFRNKQRLEIAEVPSGKVVSSMPVPEGSIFAFSPDEASIAFRPQSGPLTWYSIQTAAPASQYTFPYVQNFRLAANLLFTVEGRASSVGRPQPGDLQALQPDGSVRYNHQVQAPTAAAIVKEPDGSAIALGYPSRIEIFNYANPQPAASLVDSPSVSPTALVYSTSRRTLLAAAANEVRSWVLPAPKSAARIVFDSDVSKLSIDARGERAGVVLADGSIRILDVNNLQHVASLPLKDPVFDLIFCPKSEHVLAVGLQQATLWNLSTNTPGPTLLPPEKLQLRSTAVHPSSQRLAAAVATPGNNARSVRVWELPNGSNPKDLPHDAEVIALAFSPSGNHFASVTSADIRVWQTSDWREVARLPVAGRPSSMAFSPDGTRLAITSSDGNVYVTPWRRYDLIQSACDRLVRKTLHDDEVKQFFIEDEKPRNYCRNLGLIQPPE